MSKLFISKIDNKSFTTQEDLIEHLVRHYSLEDTLEGKTAEIVNKLQNAFPFAEVRVMETANSGEKTFGSHKVLMNWLEFDSDFTFFIGISEDVNYYYPQFENIEGAIEYYFEYVSAKDEIISELNKIYYPDNIQVLQMFEGDSNNDSFISFEIQKDGKSFIHKYTLYEDKKAFISSIRGFFDSKFEGEVSTLRDVSTGYIKEVAVDGVPINFILQRAKKLRVEVIE